jgi:cell wall-associated NlpC family hydrolase
MAFDWTPEMEAAALAEAERWRGTPHRHRRAIVGRGIDCLGLVAKLMAAAGAVPDTPIPAVPLTWGIGERINRMAALLDQAIHAERIQAADWTPRTGDIAIWAVGSQSNHVGLVLGPDIWHVCRGWVVAPEPTRLLRSRIQEALRQTAPGLKTQPERINLYAREGRA